MAGDSIHLHGGPLDGAVRPTPEQRDGAPPEFMDFEIDSGSGLWYAQYRRGRHAGDGWHFEATGVEKRADEE